VENAGLQEHFDIDSCGTGEGWGGGCEGEGSLPLRQGGLPIQAKSVAEWTYRWWATVKVAHSSVWWLQPEAARPWNVLLLGGYGAAAHGSYRYEGSFPCAVVAVPGQMWYIL